MNKRLEIVLGQRYGRLTVLAPAQRDRYGHIQYRVACDCGNVYNAMPRSILSQKYGCKDCCVALRQANDRSRHLGERLNGWQILSVAGQNAAGIPLYMCKCLRCGTLCKHTYGQITSSKSSRCESCPPDYHFSIEGDHARGVLSDGSCFIVDVCAVPLAETVFWRNDTNGYIVGVIHTPEGNRQISLHRFVIGADENAVVDHINRDRHDCRASNLRLVTQHQNSLNKSYLHKSVSGYLGVTKMPGNSRYQARIGLNNRMIHLGVTKDAVEAAQLYNTAAQLLYGEFAGELNPVPDAPLHIVRQAVAKCRAVMSAAAAITTAKPPVEERLIAT